MKTKLLPLLLALCLPVSSSVAVEITAADVARHLGIHFWKFDADKLPDHYSVALRVIKDGRLTDQSIGAFSFPDKGNLIIGVSPAPNGRVIPTISVGTSVAGVDEARRPKVGMSVKHEHTTVTPEEPLVLCGDYRSDGKAIVATGKIEDVTSGLALLILER